jgi:MFS family permease
MKPGHKRRAAIMFRFCLSHPRMLAFGVLMTLFSSFGQTFLISIFVPRILETFGLGTATFGMIYAGATLTSAFCLPYFGRLIDRVPLAKFSLAAGGGLALACFAMALSWNVPTLFVSLLALRLAGQGLLSLTAATTMARHFGSGRGKALSVSALGYPLGEGLLPLLIVLLVHAVGWRLSWCILGGVILCILLPATHSLVGRGKSPTDALEAPSTKVRKGHAMRDATFYLLLPTNLFLPFVLTALFLYQIPLAAALGWGAQTMAAAFIGFAVARLVMSLAIGPLIDRWSATRFFPYILIPASLGIATLVLHDAPWVPYAYLLLVGLSQGMAGPVMTAVWAEVYGVESLGATKGAVATFGVLATALGPLVFGYLLGSGMSFETLLQASLGLAVASIGIAWFAKRRMIITSECEMGVAEVP